MGAVRVKREGSSLELWWPEGCPPAREKLEKLVRNVSRPLEFIAGKAFCARIALGSRPEMATLALELTEAGR